MLQIHQVQAFSDNYIWIISDGTSAWVVDPGDSVPVIAFLDRHQLSLSGILLTHWHGDHQGGVEDLRSRYGECRVIGSNKTLKGPSRAVSEGQIIDVLGAAFRVIEVPGHTLDHVAFFSDSKLLESPVAFTGDTLFVAGCGRLFEGTPEDMYGSLQKLNTLPENTSIYCAHEYTLANLKYAVVAEPENPDIQRRLVSVEKLRTQDISTVPTTLFMERLTNPFLRSRDSSELAARRLQKDNF